MTASCSHNTYFLIDTFLTNAFYPTHQSNIDTPQVVTYRHIVILTIRLDLQVQVGEVEQHAVGGVHADDPGAVHVVGVVAGVGGGVDLAVRCGNRTPTSWG